MEASTAITEASAAEGFHLDSSKSKPRFMNVHNQSNQPSMEMSQITNARLFRTPMDVPHKDSNQLFQSPTMDVSQKCSNQLGQLPMNVSPKARNHMFQSPIDVSQIANDNKFQSPMDVSQIDCNHMFQSPMYGRNLLKSFQDVMGNPGKHLCCISINFILSIILYEIIKSYILSTGKTLKFQADLSHGKTIIMSTE
jgi:hypothetical protein